MGMAMATVSSGLTALGENILPSAATPPPRPSYARLVEVDQNQYSVGSPSACTVMSCEMASKLLQRGDAQADEAEVRGLLRGVLAEDV